MSHPAEKPDQEQMTTDSSSTGQTPSGDARLEELEAKLKDATDKMLRALAEAENTRRRAEKERQDVSKFAISSFARDMLGVADNLRRALAAIPADQRDSNPAMKNIFTGVEATERELQRVLESNGIRKIDPIDQKFDANLHEVMFEVDVADKPPGTIVQVIESGYTIHERLLRPARVGVAKGGTGPGKLDQQA
jgi:molecular chaperone GrpE